MLEVPQNSPRNGDTSSNYSSDDSTQGDFASPRESLVSPTSSIDSPTQPPPNPDQIGHTVGSPTASYPTRRRASTTSFRRKRRKHADPAGKQRRASTTSNKSDVSLSNGSENYLAFHQADFEMRSESKSDVPESESEDLSDLSHGGSLDMRHRKNRNTLRDAWSSLRNGHDSAYPRGTVNHLQSQLTDLNIELNTKNEYSSYLEAQNSALREELRESNESSKQLAASIEVLVHESERFQAENKILTQTVQQMRQHDISKLEENIKLLEKENADLKADKYEPGEYRNELFTLRYERKQHKLKNEELSKQVVVLTQQNALYEEKVNFLSETLQDRSSLAQNLGPDLQELLLERDEIALALHEAEARITELEVNHASTELVIGRPVVKEINEDSIQIAWKKLGKSIVEAKDLKEEKNKLESNVEKMRIQIAELRSENKQLSRRLNETRRMSVVLIEEMAKSVNQSNLDMDDDDDDMSSDSEGSLDGIDAELLFDHAI